MGVEALKKKVHRGGALNQYPGGTRKRPPPPARIILRRIKKGKLCWKGSKKPINQRGGGKFLEKKEQIGGKS